MAFEVRASRVKGAGDGLFAKRDLAAGELFAVPHSRRRFSATCTPDKESLSFSVAEDVDPEGACCRLGVLTTYRLVEPAADGRGVGARRAEARSHEGKRFGVAGV